MALQNEILTGNGEAATQSGKRKSARKSGASVRDQVTAAAKRLVNRASESMETLYDQQPNPFHQPTPPFIWIDFPKQNEILRGPTYNVRLGVGGAELVEISIDKSPWLPCRLTSGYWWYDWSNIAHGKHTLVARMRASGNRWIKTPPRQCNFRSE